ncbi:hypothetical protein EX30DRAFT_344555 [Ascodesmis nigricans]|uniref:Transcriptional regulatory protein RXT2 N-terminal domain-containing protein n=1 Tax=Ascodesmis nigricans TaxID=341454 RepID=A0A4S2MJ78_9PEZI|nr:hypothetical protein EX30DRAFT_344555 [Ascodesmis nigricans]
MAAERQYIQETIANVKRALEIASDDSESDNDIAYTSNRGRKLKRKAQHVHEGALDNHFGMNGYKEEVDFYGKKKKIIYRKSGRRKKLAVEFDDDSEEDSEDASVEDLDPYAEVDLSKLLAPLKSAADLPSHPAMSHPYTSHTLNDLVQQSLNKVCEEQEHNVVLKRFLTKLLGDDPWVNLEKMEEPEIDHARVAHEKGEALFKDYPCGPAATTNGTSTSDVPVNGHLTNGTSTAADGDTEVMHGLGIVNTNSADAAPIFPDQPALKDKHESEPTVDAETLAGDHDSPSREENIPEPRRMTTRSTNNNSNNPHSPPTLETSPQDVIDPFFIPPVFNIDRNFGLPQVEADETRRMLMAAVQRQDEFLRGLNRLRMGLLRAERLRKKVWEWCRTMEGMREYHQKLAEANPAIANFDIEEGENVGLSDDEDWYDMQAWKLDEGLEKGREEEDEGLEPLPGKKTRGRNR